MSDQTTAPRKMFAVVATGVTTPEGLPKFLTRDNDTVYPVVLFMHADRAVAERRKNSIRARQRSIKFFDGPGMSTSDLIIGVVPVSLPPKKAGKPMTAEHKAAMQAARKRSEPAAIAGSVPPKKK